jgi:hypothetical protein
MTENILTKVATEQMRRRIEIRMAGRHFSTEDV